MGVSAKVYEFEGSGQSSSNDAGQYRRRWRVCSPQWQPCAADGRSTRTMRSSTSTTYSEMPRGWYVSVRSVGLSMALTPGRVPWAKHITLPFQGRSSVTVKMVLLSGGVNRNPLYLSRFAASTSVTLPAPSACAMRFSSRSIIPPRSNRPNFPRTRRWRLPNSNWLAVVVRRWLGRR